MNDITKEAKRRNAKQARGICRRCNEKAQTGRTLCEKHRLQENSERRRRYHAKKSQMLCVVGACQSKNNGKSNMCHKHYCRDAKYYRDYFLNVTQPQRRKKQCDSPPTSTTKPSKHSKTPRSN